MPETDIGKLDKTDITNQLEDYSVDAAYTEGPSDQKETEWTNTNWNQWFGYYTKIPELRAAIDAKATWTVGKGFTADERTTLILMGIKGWGKDTFNTIIENMIRTYHIGGDAFAEIITDNKGFLINLKPLDPETIKIVSNRKGVVIRYEQINRVNSKKNLTWQPEEIFHLARNRVADEIHGVSVLPAIEEIILMRNEAMADQRKILHRNVPHVIWHVDTDDTNKIATFKSKIDETVKDRENIIIPKGSVEREIGAVASNATLNPLPWIEALNDYFFEAVGVPKIIVGNSKNFTDAASKISYLVFEQTIAEEQLFVMEQVLSQLNLVIKLTFPATLEQDALSSKPKVEERGEEPVEPAAQPNDTTMEMEGKT